MAAVETAPTLFAEVNGVKYAYRKIGPDYNSAIPIVFCQHFRGTIDHWDPDLINPLSKHHPVILIDNAGVGHSTGEVADSVAGMAKHIETVIDHLGLKEIYLYGFSLGGMVVQQVTLDTLSRNLVKKLFIVGSSPGAGPNTPPATLEQADIEGVRANSGVSEVRLESMQKLFFYPTPTSLAASEKWWARIHRRTKETSGEERAPYLPLGQGLMNMSMAGRKWATGEGALERLPEIKIPVFISNGKADYMLPTQHSWVMSERLPNAQLIVYPDSGHGAGFQFAELHAKHVLLFLED
ncbi:hypothetical protein H2198_000388 [Neophaeococcomyces mojaviensis]|uniref:Uncharacterized protein n=1 Tax=Neophaeococcomyces mojaviensis TaxID=3383035 RepID=A0ACC3AKJ2_9EURO|nr:hypothetical protein H2198_000388 [Knufia sp. JES_112]